MANPQKYRRLGFSAQAAQTLAKLGTPAQVATMAPRQIASKLGVSEQQAKKIQQAVAQQRQRQQQQQQRQQQQEKKGPKRQKKKPLDELLEDSFSTERFDIDPGDVMGEADGMGVPGFDSDGKSKDSMDNILDDIF